MLSAHHYCTYIYPRKWEIWTWRHWSSLDRTFVMLRRFLRWYQCRCWFTQGLSNILMLRWPQVGDFGVCPVHITNWWQPYSSRENCGKLEWNAYGTFKCSPYFGNALAIKNYSTRKLWKKPHETTQKKEKRKRRAEKWQFKCSVKKAVSSSSQQKPQKTSGRGFRVKAHTERRRRWPCAHEWCTWHLTD